MLEYLEKSGPTNTFKLARELDIGRTKILRAVEYLSKKQAVEVRAGTITFIKFLEKPEAAKLEPKKLEAARAKKPSQKKPKPERKPEPERESSILEEIQKEKSALENIREEDERLEKRLSRLELKSWSRLHELEKRTYKLENIVKELDKKLSAYPRIVRKTIIKKVPARAEEAEPAKEREEASFYTGLQKKLENVIQKAR